MNNKFHKYPTTAEIKAARVEAKLTQTNAAKLIYCGLRTWQQWEAGTYNMHPAFFHLFLIRSRDNDNALP